jgi:hypothetical protein
MASLKSIIAGLDEDDIAALKAAGIKTAERLLDAAKDVKGRKLLAQRTGIDPKRVLANACDQMRIKGMGKGYVVLLRESGCSTVRELKYRNPASLSKRMADTNKKRKLVRFLPPERLVARWIDQAKKLPLKISY